MVVEGKPVSDAARVRELQKYFYPWQQLYQPTRDSRKPSTSAPHTAGDRSLTSFAQLAALRLNVKRAVISLVDDKTQYILTEATQSISLQDDNRHSTSDGLLFGYSVIARHSGICEYALTSSYTVADPDGHGYSAKACVCPDLSSDERFNHRDYVIDGGARSYAGVPIRTASGIEIGVYAILHDKPRPALTYDELRFMEDVAAAIFDHLALVKGMFDSFRGQRMIHGLTSFIEGHSSSSIDSPNISQVYSSNLFADQLSNRDDDDDENVYEDRHSVSGHPNHHSRIERSNLLEPHKHAAAPIASEHVRSKVPRLAKSDSHTSITSLIDRACQALRETTNTDGVIFFDASSGSYGDKSPKADGHRPNNWQTAAHNESSDEEPLSPPSDSYERATSAKVLGASFLSESGTSTALSLETLGFSIKDLGRYLWKYPEGKVFNFNNADNYFSGEDAASDTSVHDPDGKATQLGPHNPISERRRFRAEDFVKMLPNARSVIFLPLWSYSQEKWYAGGLLWTTHEGRILNPDHDLLFAKAFGNSIMSEVTRLEAVKTDLAKTNFIASMSHELRSPLHGILGSLEFLRDSTLDGVQSGLIHSIEICGKTLLDTIDHVLDFAKINNVVGSSHKATSVSANRARTHLIKEPNITSHFDVAALVEEACEALYVGQVFKRTRSDYWNDLQSGYSDITPGTASNNDKSLFELVTETSEKFKGNLKVALKIAKRDNWSVVGEASAVRRILINLFGNSLKYTETGTIVISLRDTKGDNPTSKTTKLQIKITDTGKGMSPDYLRDRLYMPFSQQDPFSTGTGLGLSIVRQLVTSLRGDIEVRSQEKVGTEVTVSLNLPTSQLPVRDEQERKFLDIIEEISGDPQKQVKMCFLDPYADDLRKGNWKASTDFQSALIEICEDWLGINAFRAPGKERVLADFYVYAEPPPIAYLLKTHNKAMSSPHTISDEEPPLILICTNVAEAAALKSNGMQQLSDLGRVIEIISQPVGPRKFASALSRALQRANAASQHNRPTRAQIVHSEAEATSNGSDLNADRNETSQTTLDNVIYPDILSEDVPPSLPSSQRSQSLPSSAGLETYQPFGKVHKPPLTSAKPEQVISRLSALGPLVTEALSQDGRVTNTIRRPNVLIVDDNIINLRLLSTFMRKCGYPFREASDGLVALNEYKSQAEASERFQNITRNASATADPHPDTRQQEPRKVRKPPFDYIFMDLSMPVMSGFESTREIRKFEAENGITQGSVIIALTGLGSERDQNEARDCGVDHFIRKPVKFKDLRAILDGEITDVLGTL